MKISLLILFIICGGITFGQNNSYQLFTISTNAAVSALGGEVVTGTYHSIGGWQGNPALINDSLNHWLEFDYSNYIAGSSLVGASFLHKIKKIPLQFNLKHLGYGEFTGTDDMGNVTTNFSASEDVLSVGTSMTTGNFSGGLQLKFLSSRLDSWVSSALALDLGVVFTHPQKHLVAGMVISNLGVVLSNYTDTGLKAKIPLDVKIGVSYKPENMPFRFTSTIYQIAPNQRSLLLKDNLLEREQKLFAFLNAGGEFIVNEHFQVIMGLNFRQRYEMKLSNGASAGFNYGLRFKKSSFGIEYGRSSFHIAQPTHQVSLLVDGQLFNQFSRRNHE